MARRAALVAILVVAVSEPSIQIVLGVIVVVCAITYQFYARPFVSESLDYLDTISLVSLVVFLCCGRRKSSIACGWPRVNSRLSHAIGTEHVD